MTILACRNPRGNTFSVATRDLLLQALSNQTFVATLCRDDINGSTSILLLLLFNSKYAGKSGHFEYRTNLFACVADDETPAVGGNPLVRCENNAQAGAAYVFHFSAIDYKLHSLNCVGGERFFEFSRCYGVEACRSGYHNRVVGFCNISRHIYLMLSIFFL